MLQRPIVRFLLIVVLLIIAGIMVLPSQWSLSTPAFMSLPALGPINMSSPEFTLPGSERKIVLSKPLKQGLDIRGGVQITVGLETSGLPATERAPAAEAAREVISRRVDLYGITEPLVQTVQQGDNYRLLVELPGVSDPSQAVELVGQTAQLSFALLNDDAVASTSGEFLTETALTGAQLKRALVQFNQQTGEPEVSIEFNEEGKNEFGKITEANQGKRLAILLDGAPLMAPTINEPIYGGAAVITGQFTAEEAKQLAIQLSAGALPVPISILEQKTIGASLGIQAVKQSVYAGLLGLGLVMIFMVLIYRWQGVIACVALVMYAILTIAIYKMLNVTLSLPGIAGLILAIGMAVDANILIFERMKEELRLAKPFVVAMELGFGKAWESIKDANIVTILTALVLINPLNFSFLNTSGAVRGFGITLLIGVVLGLFTGIIVTRTLMRLFLKESRRGAA